MMIRKTFAQAILWKTCTSTERNFSDSIIGVYEISSSSCRCNMKLPLEHNNPSVDSTEIRRNFLLRMFWSDEISSIEKGKQKNSHMAAKFTRKKKLWFDVKTSLVSRTSRLEELHQSCVRLAYGKVKQVRKAHSDYHEHQQLSCFNFLWFKCHQFT
jgi:hypothetical protein